MYWRDPGTGAAYGVLNDFDLASISGEQSQNQQRTGTRPFMAFELLRQRNSIVHEYRHDFESFFWVTVFVAMCYDGYRVVAEESPMLEWVNLDNATLAMRKGYYFLFPDE